jgi:hypothetical protein
MAKVGDLKDRCLCRGNADNFSTNFNRLRQVPRVNPSRVIETGSFFFGLADVSWENLVLDAKVTGPQ